MTVNTLITYCDEASVPALREKVRGLFRASNESVLEDRLVELEVGAGVAERISPIRIEPLANLEERGRGNAAKSPDYGFDLPDSPVFLEVTRIRIGFLEEWNNAADRVASSMAQRVDEAGLTRSIEFTAPMEATAQEVGKLGAKEVLNAIVGQPQGELAIEMESGRAEIRWRDRVDGAVAESPVVLRLGDATIELHGEGVTLVSQGAFEMKYRATFDAEPEERFFGSIRNSLRSKRREIPANAPYILATNVHRVNSEAVSQAIVDRLFTNRDYARISGILLFTPTRSWSPPKPALLLLHANPNV